VSKYLQDVHPQLFHKQQKKNGLLFVDIRCKKGMGMSHPPPSTPTLSPPEGRALSASSSSASSSEMKMSISSRQQLSSKEKFFYKEAISIRDCFPGIFKG
jgi:hypothetical protein